MKEKILVTKENYKELIYSLKYGYELVTYESEEVHSLVLRMIEVINEFTNNNTVREDVEVIDDVVNGEWVSTKVPDLYRLISSSHDEPIPVLHDDNYKIEEIAIESKEKSIVLNINNFNYSLVKYAKKIAIKHNVKFTGSGFNGKAASVSIKKQLEDAFLSGKCKVSFPGEVFNPQTIRNYTSIYGSLVGRKFRVELSKGEIIVHFKEEDDIKALFVLAKDTFDKIGLKAGESERDEFFSKLLGNYKVSEEYKNDNLKKEFPKPAMIPEGVSLVRTLYGKPVSEEEYRNAAHWQRCGFASEYNWENGIEGDVDMYPKDVRIEDDNDDDDEDQEPTAYNWDDDSDETDDF